jgi:CBS domain containing-hemolysin-like protein
VAGDVMVPRVAVDSLSRHDSVADLRRMARETGHSRFPVTGEDLDEVVGVVHVKDSFKVSPERRSITPVGHIAKPALAIPDSRPLDQLLIDMQRQSRALAIVVDEYGGTAGIITIEDLLEEILGEIADEHDPVDANGSAPQSGNQREVPGQINRHDLDEEFGLVLPEGHFETLGGFVISQLGRFPQPGDRVTHNGWVFEVIEMDGRRIDRVKVTIPEESS